MNGKENERRIYYSFGEQGHNGGSSNGAPSQSWGYGAKGNGQPQSWGYGAKGNGQPQSWGYGAEMLTRPRLGFSKKEITHIALATLILTVAFSFALGRNFGDRLTSEAVSNIVRFLPIAFAAVSTAFVLHELGHKFTAQRFGLWSEFRYSLSGLFMALILSVSFGIVLAAPGAVHIVGRVSKRENGIISIAGPAVNIVVALIALPLLLFAFPQVKFWTQLIYTVFFINSFLALFNMLPIGNMDGKKVMEWNPALYAVGIVLCIALFVAAFNMDAIYDFLVSLGWT